MSLFNVTMRDWIIQQLNPEQRQNEPLINLIESWLEPVADLFSDFDLETNQNLIRAKASGQPIKMRQALSLLTGIRGITVTVNTEAILDNFLFLPTEQLVYIGLPTEDKDFVLYLPTETSDDFSFTVGVPAGDLTTEVEAQIRAELLFFGTATQNFNIVAI